MTRTFEHRFQPSHLSPCGGSNVIKLTVQEIEQAGVNEVLQTAGARVSSWAILEALLEPSEDAFVFREPLGVAREVKVAASGLFGRFVARAYLERHMGLSFFGHLGGRTLVLDGNGIEVRRKKKSGDLPDWVACASQLKDLTVAEAKGCHDRNPTARLARAYEQAGRVEVLADGKVMSVKRVAVVTRWASKIGGAKTPIITVKDPEELGDPETTNRIGDAGLGLARLHMANLLEPLGLRRLANSIHALVRGSRRKPKFSQSSGDLTQDAEQALSDIRPRQIRGSFQGAAYDGEGLIGAFITRAGPLNVQEMSEATAETLRGLALRPLFVGIDRRMLHAIIKGDSDQIALEAQRRRDIVDSEVATNSAGTWLVDVGGRLVVH